MAANRGRGSSIKSFTTPPKKKKKLGLVLGGGFSKKNGVASYHILFDYFILYLLFKFWILFCYFISSETRGKDNDPWMKMDGLDLEF